MTIHNSGVGPISWIDINQERQVAWNTSNTLGVLHSLLETQPSPPALNSFFGKTWHPRYVGGWALPITDHNCNCGVNCDCGTTNCTITSTFKNATNCNNCNCNCNCQPANCNCNCFDCS